MIHIHTGNHFTIKPALMDSIVQKLSKAKHLDLFLLIKPLVFRDTDNKPQIYTDMMADYKLDYKFGSSFSGRLKSTAYREKNILICKSLFVDLLLYIQKQLSDKGMVIKIEEIPFDDPATYQTLSQGCFTGLDFLELKSGMKRSNISNFADFSACYPDYNQKHTLHFTYWLAYLKSHHPIEFLTSYVYLSFTHYPGLLHVVQELREELCANENSYELAPQYRNIKGFFYPGKYVTWRKDGR